MFALYLSHITMPMTPEQARLNGKKGGRPKNLSTVKSEEARNLLAQMVFDEIVPIAKKLIEQSKKGNVHAIKELFDRAFGKPNQSVDIKAAITMANIMDSLNEIDIENGNTD